MKPTRRLLFILPLFFTMLAAMPTSGQTVVQAWKVCNSSAEPFGCTFTSNITSGNAILTVAIATPFTVATLTITDTLSSTYAHAIDHFTGTSDTGLWMSYACTTSSGGANTVTFDFSATGNFVVAIAEVSSIATSACLDKTATGINSSTTTWTTSATATLSQANEYVYVGCGNNGATSWTVGSGYGNFAQISTGGVGGAAEDKIVTATDAVSGAMTASPSSSGLCGIATIKAAGAGPGRNRVIVSDARPAPIQKDKGEQ